MGTHYPDDFKCPISLEIMSDPVILQSGHTFDRSSIQRWLDSGHRTCPITKLPLPEHPSLIPNHALRSLISSFTFLSSSKLHHRPLAPPSLPSPSVSHAQMLVSTLVSVSSPPSSKLDALSQLNRMTKLDPLTRRKLSELGAVSAVLNSVNSSELGIQEKALTLLLNLSLDDDNKVGLVAEGVIGLVVRVLVSGSSNCRAIGCTILTSLAVVEVNKATIGAYSNAIEALVTILSSGKGREVKEAATTLYALCSFVGNRRRVVDCGAVPILVRLCEMGLERAVEVLSVLVKCKEGREDMVRINGCVKAIVKAIKRGSCRGVQFGLFTLNCLCCYCEEICMEAKEENVLEICVKLVEDENEKIVKNASALMQTLST